MILYFILNSICSTLFPYSKTLELVCNYSKEFDTISSTEKDEIRNHMKKLLKIIEKHYADLFNPGFERFYEDYRKVLIISEGYAYFYSNLIKILKSRFEIKNTTPFKWEHKHLVSLICKILFVFEFNTEATALEILLRELDSKIMEYKFKTNQNDKIIFKRVLEELIN